MSTLKKPALIAGSLVLVLSLLFLADGGLTLADESEFEDLTTLAYKLEGTDQGEPTEYWYRLKDIGSEEEHARLDVSPLESEETRIVILDKENKTVLYKEMGTDSWQKGSSMMFTLLWNRHREGVIAQYGDADDWRSLANSDKEEYLLEGEENGDTVRVYDIEVDEPIDDSVFNPDAS